MQVVAKPIKFQLYYLNCVFAFDVVMRKVCYEASMAQSLEQVPLRSFDSLVAHSYEKSQLTLRRKSWVFSGHSVHLPQGKLTGWVRINTVKKVSQLF